MIIATIAIAVLLGSASVAQAGRKCIACALPEDLPKGLSREERNEIQHTCGTEDLSKYLALPAQELTNHGILIKDCGDDPCFTIRNAYINPSGSLAGRPTGTRGCFTPEIREVIRMAAPATNSPAACRKKFMLEAEGTFF